MHNAGYILVGITPPFKQWYEFLHVGDRIEVKWALLFPESAIQVATNPNMPRISGYLADMINVVDYLFEIALHIYRC